MTKITAVMILVLLATHSQAREPVVTTEQFAFYNDYETNLNDALVAAGVARKFGHDELFQTGEEQACFEALAPSIQAGWRLAVDYYTEVVSPHEFNDRQQYVIRLSLAGVDFDDARSIAFLDLAASFRRAASPAYTACRWSAQESANRRWIDGLTTQLARHESKIAARLADLYQQAWPDQHLIVDVVSTVNWAGANSFFSDNSVGHILISPGSTGHEALETVFHEASHGFMLRHSPLQQSIATAAEALKLPVPEGLWHVVLFYTTGETIRSILKAAGEGSYEPMIYGIYSRSNWGNYQDSMEANWPAYMNGSKAATDAAVLLIRQINSSERAGAK